MKGSEKGVTSLILDFKASQWTSDSALAHKGEKSRDNRFLLSKKLN